MAEPITVTDDNIDSLLLGEKPLLLLISNGDGLRGDFLTAFKKAADEQRGMIFARLDPTQNPKAAERFEAGGKPVLLGLYCGEQVVRRSKPWGTDMPLAVEMIQSKMRDLNPDVIAQPADDEAAEETADSAPVIVTDATFQQEVIDYHLPVLVDFWAPWCGPCKMVAPILDKLAGEFAGQIRIAKVNTDENPALAQSFQIMSIPTIMLIKDRTIVFSQPGALPESAMRDLINQLIALKVPPRDQQNPPEQAE